MSKGHLYLWPKIVWNERHFYVVATKLVLCTAHFHEKIVSYTNTKSQFFSFSVEK